MTVVIIKNDNKVIVNNNNLASNVDTSSIIIFARDGIIQMWNTQEQK